MLRLGGGLEGLRGLVLPPQLWMLRGYKWGWGTAELLLPLQQWEVVLVWKRWGESWAGEESRGACVREDVAIVV